MMMSSANCPSLQITKIAHLKASQSQAGYTHLLVALVCGIPLTSDNQQQAAWPQNIIDLVNLRIKALQAVTPADCVCRIKVLAWRAGPLLLAALAMTPAKKQSCNLHL